MVDDIVPQLIVGLGNPGSQYALSRHNAGCWLVDRLALACGSRFRRESRIKAESCRIQLAGRALWLLKPTTFMNLSGRAVGPFMAFYKIPLQALLVVHDDLDLPPGIVRLKRGGGHGGHNGLRDIIRQLGGNDFLRLRLGIGHPGAGTDVIGYVLRRPPESEQGLIMDAIDATFGELGHIVDGHIQQAMQVLHSHKPADAFPN